MEVQLHALSEIHDQGLNFKIFSGSQMGTRIQSSSIQFENPVYFSWVLVIIIYTHLNHHSIKV